MRLIRFSVVFALIGGAVLIFHDDVDARPAHPSNLVHGTTLALADDHEDRGNRSGFLGVSVTRMSDQLRDAFEVPEGVGVLIEQVENDSPAARAGLRAGDVIVSFDGDEIDSGSELSRAIRRAGADTNVAIGFYRKGRFRQESVGLAARSAQRVASFHGPKGSDNWSDEEWEEWGEEFGERMSEWGEEFGAKWEAKGAEWEAFGERMAELGERLGEEWGEEQAEKWEAWGEEFGEHMEEWGERFGEHMEQWAERFESRWEDHEGNVFDEEDMAELQATIHDALSSVDWNEIEHQIQGAVGSVDWEEIQADVQESLDSVNWEDMNADVHSAIKTALESLQEAGVLVETREQ